MRQYTERRLYFADKCSKCGKGFQSFKRSRIKHELCRKCRKNAPNPNQTELFAVAGIPELEKISKTMPDIPKKILKKGVLA